VVPSNPKDAKGLLKTSVRDDDPVIFMESELMYGDKGEVPEDDDFLIPIGKADVVREGDDITIVSFGKMMKVANETAQELAKDDIAAEVIDLRTIRPIDYAAVVNSVKKTNRLVVVEEAWPLGAISSEIAYHIQRHAFDYLDAPIRRINNWDVPLPYAPTLIEPVLPNVQKTLEACKDVLYV
jgi:pyruvate dehydrogenase E1 component beta subunit